MSSATCYWTILNILLLDVLTLGRTVEDPTFNMIMTQSFVYRQTALAYIIQIWSYVSKKSLNWRYTGSKVVISRIEVWKRWKGFCCQLGLQIEGVAYSSLSGAPFVGQSKFTGFWEPVVPCFHKKNFPHGRAFICFWRQDHFNLGYLSILPIYYVSLFKIPMRVAKSIERIQRNFVVKKGAKEGSDINRWEIVSGSSNNGGIAVGHLEETSLCGLVDMEVSTGTRLFVGESY